MKRDEKIPQDSSIYLEHLSFGYTDVLNLEDITLDIKKGQYVSVIGHNGCGKSTLSKLIDGILVQNSGEIYIDGKEIASDPDTIKNSLGVVFQNSSLDKQLSVKDNLESRASLYKIYGADFQRRIDTLNTLIEFKSLWNRPIGKLSGGQRRKIDIIRALLHSPRILILDEPTTGLDPQTRVILWNAIEKLRVEEKLTVFLTTHYMEEAADADHVLVLDRGKKVAFGTPLELKNKYSGDYINLYETEESKIKSLDVPYEQRNNHFRLKLKNTEEATKLIIQHPDLFRDYEVIKGNMDDVFLAITGKSLENKL